MSLASSRLQFTHLVTTQRNANAGTPNSWGNPSKPGWTDNITGLPCRVWTTAGREAVDATTTAVVEDMRLICPLGTDVTEQDRLGDITYRDTVIVAGPIGIQAVMARQDHLELVLTRLA